MLEGRYVRKIRTSKSEANLGWGRFKQIIDENEASFVVGVAYLCQWPRWSASYDPGHDDG